MLLLKNRESGQQFRYTETRWKLPTSGAVNIALRFRAPIYMAESVLESIDQKY